MRSAARLLATLLAAIHAFALAPASAEEKRAPNVLLIMADDMGAPELGCYGHPRHETPNLDRLAATGVRFETCFATPVCSPTRVMLMTGQYGFRNGWHDMIDRPGGAGGGPFENLGEVHFTFADLAKGAGHATAVAGKWQLPGEFPTRVYDCGFDEYLIWIYKGYLPKGMEYQGGWEGRQGVKVSRYFHPGVLRDNEHLATKPTDFGPDLYSDFLVDFMERHKDRPFFAYYPMCLIHSPWGPTPDRPDLKVEKTPKTLRAFVEYCDKTVGKLIAALDRLGLRDDTIVIFIGDNGTEGAGKYTPTEMGARVPLIVNGPGRVREGVASRALVDLSDIFPTIAELIGAPLPEGRAIDGRSFAKVLTGESEGEREWAFSFLADTRVLRDDRWLLEFNEPRDFGRFYDCGEARDGRGYRDVTDSTDPEVVAARERFARILEGLPAPKLDPKDSEEAHEKMRRAMRSFRPE